MGPGARGSRHLRAWGWALWGLLTERRRPRGSHVTERGSRPRNKGPGGPRGSRPVTGGSRGPGPPPHHVSLWHLETRDSSLERHRRDGPGRRARGGAQALRLRPKRTAQPQVTGATTPPSETRLPLNQAVATLPPQSVYNTDAKPTPQIVCLPSSARFRARQATHSARELREREMP